MLRFDVTLISKFLSGKMNQGAAHFVSSLFLHSIQRAHCSFQSFRTAAANFQLLHVTSHTCGLNIQKNKLPDLGCSKQLGQYQTGRASNYPQAWGCRTGKSANRTARLQASDPLLKIGDTSLEISHARLGLHMKKREEKAGNCQHWANKFTCETFALSSKECGHFRFGWCFDFSGWKGTGLFLLNI